VSDLCLGEAQAHSLGRVLGGQVSEQADFHTTPARDVGAELCDVQRGVDVVCCDY
jgi:hypothetical protein